MDIIRNDTAKQYKEVRKILRANNKIDTIQKDDFKIIRWVFYAVVVVTMLYVLTSCSMAASVDMSVKTLDKGINVNKYADAIYIIEGGKHTKHPYGILGHWHKSPRIICINTIKHQYRRWLKQGKPGAFTAFLGRVYAPVGCWNDVGTNQYWVRNLNYYLMKGE